MNKQAFIEGYLKAANKGRRLTLHDAIETPGRTISSFLGDRLYEALAGKRGIITDFSTAKHRPKQLIAKEKKLQTLLRNKQPGTKFTKAQKQSVVVPVR